MKARRCVRSVQVLVLPCGEVQNQHAHAGQRVWEGSKLCLSRCLVFRFK